MTSRICPTGPFLAALNGLNEEVCFRAAADHRDFCLRWSDLPKDVEARSLRCFPAWKQSARIGSPQGQLSESKRRSRYNEVNLGSPPAL